MQLLLGNIYGIFLQCIMGISLAVETVVIFSFGQWSQICCVDQVIRTQSFNTKYRQIFVISYVKYFIDDQIMFFSAKHIDTEMPFETIHRRQKKGRTQMRDRPLSCFCPECWIDCPICAGNWQFTANFGARWKFFSLRWKWRLKSLVFVQGLFAMIQFEMFFSLSDQTPLASLGDRHGI